MARMGNGYGSEAHLLRYLGRHRDLLNKKCLQVLGGKSIHWLDFNFDCSKTWKDSELKVLDFLGKDHLVQDAWSEFWPQRGGIHNWDAVGILDTGFSEDWILVEAKANIEEIQSSCKAKEGGSGYKKIVDAFRVVKEDLGVPEEADWMNGYYQYANRIAALHFLARHHVPAQLLFIYFVGDSMQDSTCPQTVGEWAEALNIRNEFLSLSYGHGLGRRVKDLFLEVCPSE